MRSSFALSLADHETLRGLADGGASPDRKNEKTRRGEATDELFQFL
jgi:hypothetical protein